MKLQSEQCIRKTRISTLKSYMKQVQNLYRTIFIERIEKSEFAKVQLINVNSKMRKNLFYFLTKKGRTFPLVKISFFERY